jgi:hypothetical protein
VTLGLGRERATAMRLGFLFRSVTPLANLLLEQTHFTRHVLDLQVAVSHVALPHAVLRPMGGRHIDVVSEQLKVSKYLSDAVEEAITIRNDN